MSSSNFQYKSKQPLELSSLVTGLAELSTSVEPHMPISLTRKIGEELGIDLNENILNSLLSHMCDYKINELAEEIKMSRNGKKMNNLRKNDVVKCIAGLGVEMVWKPAIQNLFHEFEEKIEGVEEGMKD